MLPGGVEQDLVGAAVSGRQSGAAVERRLAGIRPKATHEGDYVRQRHVDRHTIQHAASGDFVALGRSHPPEPMGAASAHRPRIAARIGVNKPASPSEMA